MLRSGLRRGVARWLLALLVFAGAAVLASTLGDPREPRDGPADLFPGEVVLARGTTPVAGDWRLSTYRSQGTVDERGEIVEPRGLRCVRLELARPPGGSPFQGQGYCGERGRDGFDATRLPVRDAQGRTEILLFGQAPRAAVAVQLELPGRAAIRREPYDGSARLPGDVWLIPAPPRAERAAVSWLDDRGRRAAVIDVSSSLKLGPSRGGPPR